MGYLVNGKCYLSETQAIDIYFSGVAPFLTPSGVVQLEQSGGKWFFQSQEISANLPICRVENEIFSGVGIGFACLVFLATCWGFGILRRVIW